MSVTRSPSKKTLHAAEQDRPDVAAARAELKAEQPKLKAPRLVFIDETAVTTKMVRHYGRSPRGERLVAKVPHGHWKTMTLIAGLRIDGLTAPYVIDGAMDGPAFLAYVEQVLAPTLARATSSSWTTCAPTRSTGVRKTARPDIADKQYAVIAPVLHCSYTRATENTVVGERSMGDARLDYNALTYGWFDYFLKGEQNDILKMPKVRYFTMGSNKWQTADSFPPAGAKPLKFYLSSNGKANSLNGDGALVADTAYADMPDSFTYDPINPVPSLAEMFAAREMLSSEGAWDQSKMEQRNDILVYGAET